MPHKQKLIFLVGPTASGKTALAVKLAKKFNLGIISCDSMQVYKEPKIITNKPTSIELNKIKHYLVSVVSIKENFDVALFLKLAKEAITSIVKEDKTPLIVVGTPFYMVALLDGIFEGQTCNESLRKKLYQEAKVRGSLFLHKRLEKVDLLAANKIHPNDLRRIVRALEVYYSRKMPISKMQKNRTGISNEYNIKIYGIKIKRDELYKRINLRTEKLFKEGFIKEGRKLLRKKLSKSASQILGLKQVNALTRGDIDMNEAERLVARDSRHYAKRQLTWFRRDKRIIWKTTNELLKLKRI